MSGTPQSLLSRTSGRTLAVGLWLVARLAFASPGTAILAAGDCDSPSLTGLAARASRRLSERQHWTFVTPEELSERLRPSAPKSVEALAAEIEAARSLFYDADYLKARSLIEQVLKQGSALPPGNARWRVVRDAWLLHGLILRADQPQSTAFESSFRQVLRVNPRDAMEPAIYSPNTRAAYDRVRKALGRSQRFFLEVRSSSPGAPVFIDGFPLAKTPASLALPPGDYQVVVGDGEWSAFPRQVTLTEKPQTLEVDLALEAAIRIRPAACLHRNTEADQVAGAARVAQKAGLEHVVLLRLEPQSQGPGWLTAIHLSGPNAQRVREGGIKVPAEGASSEVEELVIFALTGEPQRRVVAVSPDSTPPWLLTEDPRGKATRRALRWSAYGVGAGAVATGASALGVYLSARKSRRALEQRLSPEGFSVAGDTEAQSLASSVRTKQSVALGLTIASGIAAATSATFWYLSRPTFAKRVTLTAEAAPRLDGGLVSIQGAF